MLAVDFASRGKFGADSDVAVVLDARRATANDHDVGERSSHTQNPQVLRSVERPRGAVEPHRAVGPRLDHGESHGHACLRGVELAQARLSGVGRMTSPSSVTRLPGSMCSSSSPRAIRLGHRADSPRGPPAGGRAQGARGEPRSAPTLRARHVRVVCARPRVSLASRRLGCRTRLREGSVGQASTLCGTGLYLDGGFGVGKTHLLTAMAHEVGEGAAFGTFLEFTSLVGALGFAPAREALSGFGSCASTSSSSTTPATRC